MEVILSYYREIIQLYFKTMARLNYLLVFQVKNLQSRFFLSYNLKDTHKAPIFSMQYLN